MPDMTLTSYSSSSTHSGHTFMCIFHPPSIRLDASLTCGWLKHRPSLSNGLPLIHACFFWVCFFLLCASDDDDGDVSELFKKKNKVNLKVKKI